MAAYLRRPERNRCSQLLFSLVFYVANEDPRRATRTRHVPSKPDHPHLKTVRLLDCVQQKRHIELHDIISYLKTARLLDCVQQKRHIELRNIISHIAILVQRQYFTVLLSITRPCASRHTVLASAWHATVATTATTTAIENAKRKFPFICAAAVPNDAERGGFCRPRIPPPTTLPSSRFVRARDPTWRRRGRTARR